MEPVTLEVETLTRQSFRPFGYVIDTPTSNNKHEYPQATSANQGSALRLGDISRLTSAYDNATQPGKPVLSLFSCSPRQVEAGNGLLKLDVLEQHPYTSQTFAPLGLDHNESTFFLVIVAPPLSSQGDLPTTTRPDISNIRVFIANGAQAVTYAAGIWHAPMIVIGTRTVNFLVVQNMNGVPKDDCQEVNLGEQDIRVLVPTKKSEARQEAPSAKL